MKISFELKLFLVRSSQPLISVGNQDLLSNSGDIHTMIYKEGHQYREVSARHLVFEVIGHLEVAGQRKVPNPCNMLHIFDLRLMNSNPLPSRMRKTCLTHHSKRKLQA